LSQTCLPSSKVVCLASLGRAGDTQELYRSLGRIYQDGGAIAWDKVYECCPVAALPTYPFQRQRYWFTATSTPPAKKQSAPLAWSSSAQPAPRVHAGFQELAGGLAGTLAPLRDSREQRFHLDQFTQARKQFDELASDYVAQAFDALGWRPHPGQSFSVGQLCDQLGVLPKFHRLFGRFLNIAAEEGWLRMHAGVAEINEWPKASTDASKRQLFLDRFPEFEADFRLVHHCGKHLARVLRGQIEALDVLFGQDVPGLVERMYAQSPVSAFYNDLCQRALQQILKRLPGERPLRVLELGAGTGATTAQLLPLFLSEKTEYVFTDVSPLFLAAAREKFAGHAHLQFRVLDLDNPPGPQGFADHLFDIVLAANVVHATRDVRQSLTHMRRLLAPAGLLVLVEGTRPTRFLDLIFGLTDGWWKFSDTTLRPDYPLLAPSRWVELLREQKFTDAVVLPAQADDADLDQALILALAPAGHNGKVNGRNGHAGKPKALPPEERRAQLTAYLRAELEKVAGLALTEEDMERPLQALGLDSLMAIQLRNRVEANLGIALSIMDFLRGLSLKDLVDKAARQPASAAGAVAPPADHPAAAPAAVANVDNLSEQELDRLLETFLQ
jgi:SAM-dependent methyltransferase